MTTTTEKREPQLTVGSASANVIAYDIILRPRHAAVTVHSDASGSIGIYSTMNPERPRELARMGFNEPELRAIRAAINAHVSQDVATIERVIVALGRAGFDPTNANTIAHVVVDALRTPTTV